MSIPSFYHPNLDAKDKEISLDANESAHAAKSRRLRPGQPVRVFNGVGLVGLGLLSIVGRREVRVELNSFELSPPTSRLVSVAVAVPKGDRQKVMIDMLTQLGVSEIIPLRCEHSVTNFTKNMLEKWTRVAIEACKQSQNPWLPTISGERELSGVISDEQRSCVFANANSCGFSVVAGTASPITVLVGPEGGFSERELTKLNQLSVPSMRLGPYILRTEAAAIAAVGVLVG